MKTEPHERSDISPRGFTLLAGSYAAIVAAGALAAFAAQKILLRRLTRADAGVSPVVNVLPPEPRLESDNSAQLELLRAREDGLLSRYSWVDRKRGVARIPLDRAITVALERGFPTSRRPR